MFLIAAVTSYHNFLYYFIMQARLQWILHAGSGPVQINSWWSDVILINLYFNRTFSYFALNML